MCQYQEKKQKYTSYFLTIILLAGGSYAPSIWGAAQIEEIVVTAQRREENLQTVPLAVTAFSEELIQSLVILDTRDLARITPNFLANPGLGQGTANSYSMRGLYNHDTIPTFDPPVGTYVDDFFIQRQNANNIALFDVERIEVLRGPQGLLFGRNTTGGAVRIILKKPAEELGGWVEAGIGRFDQRTLRGSIDLPVNEKFLTKFTAFWEEDDGWVTNITTGETGLNNDENLGLRAAARWLPNDAVTWDVGISYVDNEQANLTHQLRDDGLRFSQTGLTTGITAYKDWLTGPKANFGMGNDIESIHYTSNLQWDTDIGVVNFLTAYYELDQHFLLDFFEGPGELGGFVIANDGNHTQFTQEIKLSGTLADNKIDYTTGVYYFKEDNNLDFASIFAAFGVFPGFMQYDRTMDNGTKSWAVYGALDWHLTDKLTLSGGLRYTDEEDTIGVTDNGNPNPLAPFDSSALVALGIPLTVDDSKVTPRVAIQFQQTDELMWYASATNGFKSGGWNARGVTAEEMQPFRIEQNWSYELGMRSDWWDNRLRINVTGFFTEIEDYQVPNGFENDQGQIIFLTTNRSGLETKGVEVEMTLVPVEGLTLFASGGTLDSKYVDLDQIVLDQQAECQANLGPIDPDTGIRAPTAVCGRGIVDRNGDIISGELARDYQITLGASYLWSITNNLNLIPAAHWSRYGDQEAGTSGDSTFLGGYNFVGASLVLENVSSNWSLTARCWDCTEVERITGAFFGVPRAADPALWELVFRKNF